MRAPSLLFTALEESMAFSCKARWVQSRENLGCTDRPVGIARNAYYRYFPHPPGVMTKQGDGDGGGNEDNVGTLKESTGLPWNCLLYTFYAATNRKV